MTRYFSGQGKVSVSPRDGAGLPTGFSYLGNCSDFSISLGRAGERFATNGSAGDILAQSLGGNLPVISMILDEFAKENLEKATYGKATAVSGASVSNEVVVAALGKSVPVANIGITTWTSLRDSTLATTYVQGTDYTINKDTGMLDFPASGSAIADAQSLRATYVYGAHEKVGAFTTAQPFWYLRFDGWNTVFSPKQAVVVEAYKVKLLPADGLPIITERFSAMTWVAFVDYDDLRTPSQADGNFFRIRQV